MKTPKEIFVDAAMFSAKQKSGMSGPRTEAFFGAVADGLRAVDNAQLQARIDDEKARLARSWWRKW